MHWATFNLSYHDWDEPILRTLAAAQAAGVEVITPRPGETYEHGRPFASAAWYAARPEGEGRSKGGPGSGHGPEAQ